MFMPQLQMGIFSFGPNGVFFPNPSLDLSPCLVSVKPILGMGLNFSKVRKSWVFDARTRKPGFRNVVEKEVEFSPMFDDYVKVLEAVRTERGKNSGAENDGNGEKKRASGKDRLDTPDREGNDKRGVRRATKSRVDGSASGWDLVGGILEKARAGRGDEQSDGGLEDGSSSSYTKFDGDRGNVGSLQYKKNDSKSVKYSKNQKDLVQNRKDGQRVSDYARKEAPGYGTCGDLADMKKSGNDSRQSMPTSYDRSERLNERQMLQKSGNDARKWVRGSDDSSERLDERQVPRKVVNDYRPWMRKSDDSSEIIKTRQLLEKAGSDSHPWVRKIDTDDDSGKFNERRVQQKGNRARDDTINLARDGDVYGSKIERGTYDKRNNKSLPRSEKFEDDRVPRTRSSKENKEYKITENTWTETQLTGVQRRRGGQLRKSGLGIQEMDDEQNKHEDEIKWNHGESDRYLNGSGKGFFKQGVNQTHLRSQGDATETAGYTSGSTDMRGRLGANVSRSAKFVARDISPIVHEDRAAFRSFEVITDVKNRPRVLRMELEERIEKLAKWLNAKDVNMPEWQFSKMMHSADIKFTEHSILRVVQILGALGNWQRVLQVVEWLHTRERFESYKSRYIYTTVLNVLGKAKRPVEALNIFYAMREELSSYPDLAAYHCIAVTLGQSGHLKELFDVIDCMRAFPEKKFKLGPLQKWDPRTEPDLVIYNAVLNACVQQKQWEGAFWVFQQLKQYSIKPTNTTYGLAMEVMLACGKYNLVHEFFRKVNKISVPKALNYKVLINTLWREGKIDEAVLAVQDMERRGIVGSASLYYDLARCLCSDGRCQEALLQVDKICKVAKKPLVVTYTGLIQACLDSGNMDDGAYIFNQMHKFCSPNSVTCNIMLKSYLEHGRFEEAKELFYKILDDSHDFDSKTSLRQKVIPDKYMFNSMMEACVATSNWDDFANVYEQMLYHGFHFDTRRHLRMVLDAYRAGKVQVIETTWEYMVRTGRVPPPPIVKERFCLKLLEDDPAAAISCIGIHQDIDMGAFSDKAWLNLIHCSGDRLGKNTITRLVSEVTSHVERSDQHAIFCNLLKACQQYLSFRENLVSVSESRSLTELYS